MNWNGLTFEVPRKSSQRDWSEEEMNWLENDWGTFVLEFMRLNHRKPTLEQQHAFAYGWALAMRQSEDRL